MLTQARRQGPEYILRGIRGSVFPGRNDKTKFLLWTLPSATRNASPTPTDSRKSWKFTTTTIPHPHHPPPPPAYEAGLGHWQAMLNHSHLAWVGELLRCTLRPRVLAGRWGAQAEATFCSTLRSQSCLASPLLASLLPFLRIPGDIFLILHHLT